MTDLNDAFNALPPAWTLADVVQEPLSGLRPPERVSVSEFAEKRFLISSPMTSGLQRFSLDIAPYQREILDAFSDPDCQGVRLVAPSRSGKTQILFPVLAHSVETNPMDVMIVQTSRQSAITFAKGDFARALEQNSWLEDKIRPGRTTNSMTMKRFRNGVIWSIVWPSAKNLAGVDRGIVCLPDYDRNDKDLDGEGSVYSQAAARAKLFGRRKKIFVESSPSLTPDHPIRFEPETPHQAPPYPGIFSLYNEGDRRWWYWRCFNATCREWFAAHPRYFEYPEEGTIKERAAAARMVCPHCKTAYSHDGDPETGAPGKYDLNLGGRWVPDGMTISGDGVLAGEMANPPTGGGNDYRSYWLFGPAAAQHTWQEMIENLLIGEDEAKNGDEGKWKTALNTDLALPWIPPSSSAGRELEEVKERAEDYPQAVVPPGALYLLTTVDSQKFRWEIQTQAFGPEGRMWVIDRRAVKFSDRDHDNPRTPGEKAWVRPGTYPEDWEKLTEALLSLKYPLADGSGVMVPALFGVDSAGSDATTDNAYAWWRGLAGSALTRSRVYLLKGDPNLKELTAIAYPDGTKRKNRRTSARGDIPILMISSNKIKDIVSSNLDRVVDGPGFVHLPGWAKDAWFRELISEQKHGEGWVNTGRNGRNEAWDLVCYAVALNRSELMRADRVNWESGPVPSYAKPAADNPFVSPIRPDGAPAPKPTAGRLLSLEELGAAFSR
ncbi:terminase gpA endonuclease subunit [Paracoccus sanguinis]|uniref:Phage terminase, large subunit GpA n=1 Tax=Paracoccus sanguinis TaxID=1545044 RepID=A0A099GLQ0_9RHOB|nr:terminase gpA endonuclease subunit [Paracoccus sanguinis]KGJ23769.1 hypothetical protein IX56_00400 [Paracoccus sanguinis]